MTDTTDTTRDELARDIRDAYETRDELGQALFHLAVAAAARGDMQMMRDLFEIDRMQRRGGQGVNLDSCGAFGALAQRVKGEELCQWARAVSACMDLGGPDILHALDGLARRRACH
ncbi:MAG: hypothetical protein CMN20_05755 [Roseovarius sp.]|nr:hypothetical protein [Roseovarius sp.]|tara:strand:- start:1372 stop:1719 length:348 start_codon:yes stop_codon:yes gene_type:complete